MISLAASQRRNDWRGQSRFRNTWAFCVVVSATVVGSRGSLPVCGGSGVWCMRRVDAIYIRYVTNCDPPTKASTKYLYACIYLCIYCMMHIGSATMLRASTSAHLYLDRLPIAVQEPERDGENKGPKIHFAHFQPCPHTDIVLDTRMPGAPNCEKQLRVVGNNTVEPASDVPPHSCFIIGGPTVHWTPLALSLADESPAPE